MSMRPLRWAVQRSSWRWLGAGVSTVVLLLGLTAWLQWGSTRALASAPGHRLMPASQPSPLLASAPVGGAAASAPPDDAFDEACVRLVQQRLYREALEPCKAFLGSRALAGKAHALLSAVYSTRVLHDESQAVHHARQAVQAGDARGKFLLAAHALAGHAQGVGLSQARGLLKDAAAQGVPGAQMYLDAMAAHDQCIEHTDIRPLGLPLFCMFRGEALQALTRQGARLKQADARLWLDRFQLAGVLAQASEAELAYDLSPTDELHRPVRWLVQFASGDDLAVREAGLQAALQIRYGAPSVRQPGQVVWRLPEGMRISLLHDEAEGLRLVYEQLPHMQSRAEHLEQARQQEQSDLQRAEARAL